VGPARQRPETAREAGLPWYEVAHARRAAEGRRDCGELEHLVCREWEEGAVPPPEAVRAIDRLAELPSRIKQILVSGLDAIFVGPGGVPDLDDMAKLHGVPLPSGRATWDACAGAYGERKIIVGSRPSAAPDVMCHEVGHAVDDIDGSGERWQSDSDEFRSLYDRCLPRLVSYFHRQEGGGRPARVFRRCLRRDRLAAAASARGHAGRRHQDRSRRHALLQPAIRHLEWYAMFVIKLPNGNLMAPESAVDADGQVVGDAYVEISPADPEYARLAEQALSEQEVEDRKRRWRDGDEALRREFEEYLASRGQDDTGQG
jgi:hypothetical protein